jgi:hypothetical protein
VAARRPQAGRLLRRLLYTAEHTPLQAFGLSHFLVLERTGEDRQTVTAEHSNQGG